MLRVTRAQEYAIRAMICLASREAEERVLIGDIAKATGLSRDFLAKQFPMLARAKLVASTRGATGGIALGRPADRISVRDILEAVEGPVELNACLARRGRCRNAETCRLAGVWREAQEKMLETLGKATLAELAGGKR